MNRQKTGVVGIANYLRYMVFGLSRGLYQCVPSKISLTHMHEHIDTYELWKQRKNTEKLPVIHLMTLFLIC